MTPLPPRRCARNALTAVRLIKPAWVMLMMQPSLTIRSSMLISACVGSNFRQARGAVLVADFAQFFFDDGEDALLFGENVAQIVDGLDELLVFVDDFLALESGQLIQTQVQDFVCLLFAERVAAIGEARRIANENAELFDLAFRKFECEQFHSRFVAISRSANNAQEFIEISERNEITFQCFGALFGLAQFVSCATQDDFAPMVDVNCVSVLEGDNFGRPRSIASIVVANELSSAVCL